MGMISGTFWDWTVSTWSSPGRSLSVTQGQNMFPLFFLDRISLYFSFRIMWMISGTFWVWKSFIWASPGAGGVFECHPGAKCVSFKFWALIFLWFSFRILGMKSGIFWVWKIFIWTPQGGSLSVTQGPNGFPLCFLVPISLFWVSFMFFVVSSFFMFT